MWPYSIHWNQSLQFIWHFRQNIFLNNRSSTHTWRWWYFRYLPRPSPQKVTVSFSRAYFWEDIFLLIFFKAFEWKSWKITKVQENSRKFFAQIFFFSFLIQVIPLCLQGNFPVEIPNAITKRKSVFCAYLLLCSRHELSNEKWFNSVHLWCCASNVSKMGVRSHLLKHFIVIQCNFTDTVRCWKLYFTVTVRWRFVSKNFNFLSEDNKKIVNCLVRRKISFKFEFYYGCIRCSCSVQHWCRYE